MILGPVQEQDIALIQAIIKMTKPNNVIEFGTQTGVSTRAILEVLDGHLYTFDPQKQHDIEHHNCTYIRDKQENYNLTIPVDLVFFDGSHNYDSNMEAFRRLEPYLSPTAIIMVHDTGLWAEPFVQNGGYSNSEGYLHQPHERRFVNDLKWNKIHFHTTKEVRHGMTILQRPYELSL